MKAKDKAVDWLAKSPWASRPIGESVDCLLSDYDSGHYNGASRDDARLHLIELGVDLNQKIPDLPKATDEDRARWSAEDEKRWQDRIDEDDREKLALLKKGYKLASDDFGYAHGGE